MLEIPQSLNAQLPMSFIAEGMIISLNALHEQNAESPIRLRFGGKLMVSIERQLSNAEFGIDKSDSGKIIVFNHMQRSNMLSPNVLIPSSKTTSTRLLHPLNIHAPNFSTELGITILFTEQPENAKSSITFTLCGMVIFFILPQQANALTISTLSGIISDSQFLALINSLPFGERIYLSVSIFDNCSSLLADEDSTIAW